MEKIKDKNTKVKKVVRGERKIGIVDNVYDSYVYVDRAVSEDKQRSSFIKVNDFLKIITDVKGEAIIVRVSHLDRSQKIQCSFVGVLKVEDGVRENVFDFSIENYPFVGQEVFTINEKIIIDDFYLKGKTLLEMMKK